MNNTDSYKPVVYQNGERLYQKGKPTGNTKVNYAEGLVVHHVSKSDTNPHYEMSSSSRPQHKASKSLTLQSSEYSTKVKSSLPQVRVSKPCKITFTMQSIPVEETSTVSSCDTVVDTSQEFETFSEKRIEGNGDCYMEGIIIQHNSRRTSISGSSGVYSTNYQTENVEVEMPKAAVRKASYGNEIEEKVTETYVKKRSQVTPPLVREEITEIVTTDSFIKAPQPAVRTEVWPESPGGDIESETITTVTEVQGEQEWKIVQEWVVNERGENVQKDVKMVKNQNGEWIVQDTFYETSKYQPDVTTITTTTSGAIEGRRSGEEWVRKSDGTMEQIEFYWIQDSTGNWTKMNKTTNEVITVEQTNTNFQTMPETFSRTSGSVINTTNPPMISGEYWIQRKKDNSWKQVRYQWTQDAEGRWKKVDSKGKTLPSQGHWKYGKAWELDHRAVPKQVNYEWREDPISGQWTMMCPKTHRQVDTSWQQGTYLRNDANGIDQERVNYRWVQDSRGNWLKLEQNSGQQLEMVKKGRGIDITRDATTYIYHADSQKMVKQMATKEYKKGKLVSKNENYGPLTRDESATMFQEASARQPPTLPDTQEGLHQAHRRKIHAPRLHTHKVHTPHVHTPKVHTPRVHAPKVRTPRVHAPKIRTPRVHAPKVHKPRWGKKSHQPANSSISPYNPMPGSNTQVYQPPNMQTATPFTQATQSMPAPAGNYSGFQSATAPVIQAFN